MSREQKLRSTLFYISLLIFLIGLPFILSFALAYRFNPRTFRFTKTGIIVLKTQPSMVSIYLDNKLLNETTPTIINELLPGRYNVRLELDKHYNWVSNVDVEAGKVTRLDRIILFPTRSDVNQISKERPSAFWVDDKKETIYYINPETNSVYKSGLGGEHLEKIAVLQQGLDLPIKWRMSPNEEALLFFNTHQIAIVSLKSQNALSNKEESFVLNYPLYNIIDVFWHSDSYHFILIHGNSIDVLEANAHPAIINLLTLNRKNTYAFYNIKTDTLYFLDSQKAADGNFYDNIYALELGTKISPFRELMRLRTNNGQEAKTKKVP